MVFPRKENSAAVIGICIGIILIALVAMPTIPVWLPILLIIFVISFIFKLIGGKSNDVS